jgi:arylsulfatase A-like enzyme
MDDGTLAPLLGRLDAVGHADDTLVVLTSDHGEEFLEHGIFMHGDLYRETLHVPLVLRWPGRLPAGLRVAAPVGLVDLMPTLLDLLGLPVPSAAQGTSVAALARGATSPPGNRAFSEYSDATSGRVLESLRDGPLTLVRNGAATRLFDRSSDPGETRDLAASDPARTAALVAALDRWHAECARQALALGPRPGDVATPSDETVRQLRALGYVD